MPISTTHTKYILHSNRSTGGFDGFVYIEVIIGFKQYYYQKEGLPTIAVANLSCWEIIGYSCPSKKVRVVAIITSFWKLAREDMSH